ncbi:hypothetical protein ACIBHX_40105 [Nonomuraea sp. NPDC050536]
MTDRLSSWTAVATMPLIAAHRIRLGGGGMAFVVAGQATMADQRAW